jgi:phage tail-like protein
MTQATSSPERFDPYKNFKFRVKWEGRFMAGVSRISALRRTTEAVVHREGGEPSTFRISPGLTKYDPITLERGVTHDTAFEDWANQVWRLGAPLGGEVALAGFRKDIAIELYDEAGNVALRYLVYRCWVSEYVALPNLDGTSNEVLIESITLEHEGWTRDTPVTEPRGASSTG